jgi:hypothetical protein
MMIVSGARASSTLLSAGPSQRHPRALSGYDVADLICCLNRRVDPELLLRNEALRAMSRDPPR